MGQDLGGLLSDREGGRTNAGFDRQGVGLSGFTFGGVGDVGSGTADGFVEVGTNGFPANSWRSLGGQGDSGGGDDLGGGFAADIEEAALGEENDGADQC